MVYELALEFITRVGFHSFTVATGSWAHLCHIGVHRGHTDDEDDPHGYNQGGPQAAARGRHQERAGQAGRICFVQGPHF